MSNVGRTLYGYCLGSHGNKRIEAEGFDWILTRSIENPKDMDLMVFADHADKMEHVDGWAKEKEEGAWD